MVSLMKIKGIGKMAKQRLIEMYGINDSGDLDEYILNHDEAEIMGMINNVSENPRYGKCMEGYYARKHNKRIKDGLTEYVMDINPDYVDDDYLTVRVPEDHINDLVIKCKSDGNHSMAEYQSYNNSVASDDIIEREGVAYPEIEGDGYRYGKSCMLPEDATEAERDNMIRNNMYYVSRQYYQCGCFSNSKTCGDFSVNRGNRIKDVTKPYCKWENNKCNSV